MQRNLSDTHAAVRFILALGLFLLAWDAFPILYATPFLGLGVGIAAALIGALMLTAAAKTCPVWAVVQWAARGRAARAVRA